MSNQTITDADRPTRDRLLAAGMALIAERGFNGVSVGEIEGAVGLAPRRGALYKHFPSKQALIEQAMEERITGVADLSAQVAWFASPEAMADPRSSLRLIAQVALDELDREKHINQIIEKDGNRFTELRNRMRDEMVEPGFRYAEYIFAAWVRAAVRTEAGCEPDTTAAIDVPAVATVLLSALVHHRRHEWLLGEPPHAVETDRFLDAWIEIAMRALGIEEYSK